MRFLRSSLVTDAQALEALAPAWTDLLARSDANELMLTPDWLLPWWSTFGKLDKRQLHVVVFYDDDQLVGLAPFLKRRHWHRPGLPFLRLEPLGSGERPMEAICSDYLNIIAERGKEAEVAHQFAEMLAKGRLGNWDELLLPMMDGSSIMPELLAQACRQQGLSATCTTTSIAPYIPLPSTWEEYLRSLDKKKRYSLLRTQRDFDEWAKGEAKVVQVQTKKDLEEGRRILHSLHHERWEDGGEKGVFRAPRFLAFHEAVQESFLPKGQLQLSWLSVRGTPIAALYCFQWNRKIYFYQCGRKTELPKQVRPGTILLAYAIRSAIERGMREFDFLAGAAFYKSQLTWASRPIVQLRVARPGGKEQLRRWFEWGVESTRPLRARLRSLRNSKRSSPHPPTSPSTTAPLEQENASIGASSQRIGITIAPSRESSATILD